MIKLNKNERIEDLQLNGLKIIQDGSKYCFTSDSAILSNFINAKRNDKCLEIGCGNGVVSILVNQKCNPKEIFSFEIQKDIARLANKNVKLNNLSNKIKIINAPIQDYKSFVSENYFDIVFSNPPYLKIHENCLINENKFVAISKHELTLTLKELISCASKLLKFKGKFFIVYKADRLAELIFELKTNNLEPKILLFVAPSYRKNPNIVVVEAIKNGKEGIKILPTLIANDKNGEYIYTIKSLFRGDKWYILLERQLEI